MTPDLTHRVHLEEAMDAIEDYPTYRRCLHDLDRVSGLVLAHRATLSFLNQVVGQYPGHPLSILDVACGDGSMLRRVAGWALRRGVEVRLTGVDMNPWAIRVAREFGDPGISYVVGDIFDYQPGALDVVLSAHFTHHLAECDLIRFLKWMEEHAQVGWMVNDLHRQPNPYRLFRLLTRFAPWHRIIESDGLISIQRSFTVQDWERLLRAAGLAEAVVRESFPARLTVSRIRVAG